MLPTSKNGEMFSSGKKKTHCFETILISAVSNYEKVNDVINQNSGLDGVDYIIGHHWDVSNNTTKGILNAKKINKH